MRILCLDIEGGYGGSSRSLYESVRHIADRVEIEVWCRRDGPVQTRYEALGVTCRIMADMPCISSLPRLSRNLYAFTRFAFAWSSGRNFRRELLNAAQERFDVVHFNHEGLFLLAWWLKMQAGGRVAQTQHVRTFLPATPFSRWQYRTIARNADHVVFITENECERATVLAGGPMDGTVIYNIVTPPVDASVADPTLARDTRFKVAVLSNYAWIRGIDRLVDVARILTARGRSDIVFIIAGNMALPRSLPGDLGRVARQSGNLEDYARHCGVVDMFRFLGHVRVPDPVLAACDVLAKPTREYNPWGRDILEAMAFGKPAMTVGTYDRFVENDVTGILHEEFQAERWADEIVRLAEDKSRCRRLGRAAAERVLELCDGPSRARDLLHVWRHAAGNV